MLLDLARSKRDVIPLAGKDRGQEFLLIEGQDPYRPIAKHPELPRPPEVLRAIAQNFAPRSEPA